MKKISKIIALLLCIIAPLMSMTAVGFVLSDNWVGFEFLSNAHSKDSETRNNNQDGGGMLIATVDDIGGIIPRSNNDFCGEWVGDIDITGIGIFEVNIDITESTIIMEFEFMVFGQNNSVKEMIEIISWSETANNSFNRNDFPNGFNLETRTRDGTVSTLSIYISEDKKRLVVSALNSLLPTLPSLNEDNIRIMTFTKK